MQSRTLAALAVATGLILGSAVLALGATLMPSKASPRSYVPVAADIANDPGTTIVTDVQTVYDTPVATPPAPKAAATAEPEPRATDAAPPGPAPVVTTSPSTGSAASDDQSDAGYEHESSSSSPGGSFGD